MGQMDVVNGCLGSKAEVSGVKQKVRFWPKADMSLSWKPVSCGPNAELGS
jgi:hypothetical protein